MKAFHLRLILLACVPLVGATGCGDGPSLVEATGSVSYHGKPVAKASIVLQPQEGPLATGISDEQGVFSLATRGRAGAVAGPATVAVTALEEVKSIPPGDEYPEGLHITRSRIPAKYALVAASPLTVEVTPSGENHFELELTD
ncbi:MAG: hypothetical protein U1E05_00630 [Patescibacteria group bacterium]|nr:hypothetical protein [Patescibacteria group bacterium]